VTAAAFLAILLIDLLAAIGPGPRLCSLDRTRAAYRSVKAVTDRAFGGVIAGFGIKIAAT
jgi:threonine/homoserine/homoserine lactone efflux protein